MKIVTYLINLDGSDERLKSATDALNNQHIDFIRIPAVDGRGLNVQEYKDYDSSKANANMGRDLIGAEIGCYLSHKKCLEAFLQSDAEYAVVFEDDLFLQPNAQQTINQVLQYLKQENKNWYLMNIAAPKKKFVKPIQQFNNHTLYHAYYFPMLGLGLVWSKVGARAFLDSIYGQQIFLPVDVAFQSWLCQNGLGLSVFPPLVVASGAKSDIDETAKKQTTTTRQSGKYLPRQIRMWKNRFFAVKNLIQN